jgi:TPR repeat protein
MSYLKLLIAMLLVAAGSVLAEPYEDGNTAYHREDYKTALRFWRPIAQGGHVVAQILVGHMYITGKGVTKDYTQGAIWIRKAADQGNADAQDALGNMYRQGEGVPKDDLQAYFWFLLASVNGDAYSVKNRDSAERILTPEQRAAAQADARNWKPTK